MRDMTRHKGAVAGEPTKRATGAVRFGRSTRIAMAATAALATGALLAGCNNAGSGGADAAGSQKAGDSVQVGYGVAAGSSGGSSSTGQVGRCHTSDLKVSTGSNHSGAEKLHVAVVLTNRSGHTCTVRGYPGVAFRDQTGQHTSVDPLRANGSKPTVRLAPGKSAWAPLSYVNPAQDKELETVKPSTLVVTPPNERTHLMTRWPSDPVVANGNASQYWLPKIAPLRAGTGSSTPSTPSGHRQSRCDASDLQALVRSKPSTYGLKHYAVVFINRSDRTCGVHGFPGMAFLNSQGGHVSTDPHRVQGGNKSIIRLAPGDHAWAALSFASPEVTGVRTVTPDAVKITPPNERTSLKVPWPGGTVTKMGQESVPMITALRPGNGA